MGVSASDTSLRLKGRSLGGCTLGNYYKHNPLLSSSHWGALIFSRYRHLIIVIVSSLKISFPCPQISHTSLQVSEKEQTHAPMWLALLRIFTFPSGQKSKLRVSQTAQQAKEYNNLSSIPRTKWWEEKTYSDLYLSVCARTHTPQSILICMYVYTKFLKMFLKIRKQNSKAEGVSHCTGQCRLWGHNILGSSLLQCTFFIYCSKC